MFKFLMPLFRTVILVLFVLFLMHFDFTPGPHFVWVIVASIATAGILVLTLLPESLAKFRLGLQAFQDSGTTSDPFLNTGPSPNSPAQFQRSLMRTMNQQIPERPMLTKTSLEYLSLVMAELGQSATSIVQVLGGHKLAEGPAADAQEALRLAACSVSRSLSFAARRMDQILQKDPALWEHLPLELDPEALFDLSVNLTALQMVCNGLLLSTGFTEGEVARELAAEPIQAHFSSIVQEEPAAAI